MGVLKTGSGKAFAHMCLLVAGLGLGGGAIAQERVMIVMDGSGSMWGQIDGVPKLSIARDTLRDVLPSVPQATELGLIAYGHREKGNCSDIELVIPAAAGTAAQISSAVDNMRFLGKTPLSAAVQIAAEELRYTEDKATVILITDGIETCSADPCALGNALEQQGVDFTAHVVGFGLSEEEGRQISCLAENTGGKFFLADDGDGLVEALNEVVVAAPTAELLFVAVDQDGNQVTEPMNWVIRSGGEDVVSANGLDKFDAILDDGNYTVLVSGTDISGGMELVLEDQPGGFTTIQVPVEITILSATLDAPESAAAGSEFEVIWTGPNHKSDYVTIVEIGAREGSFLDYAYTGNGAPAEVTAPDGLGTYELRYVHGPSDKTLATRPIEVTAVSGTLEAPESVAAGASFDVSWTGPDNENDFVTITELGADEGDYMDYFYTKNGPTQDLTAPDGLGTYEIRYVMNNSDRTLISRTIEVTAVAGTLSAPESVAAGGSFDVSWTGPNNVNDFVTITEVGADEGDYMDYFYTKNGDTQDLTAPDEVGTFEVRYVMGASDRTLASVTIEVTAVSGELEAPETAPIGSIVEVTWTGPDNPNDFITVVQIGEKEGGYTDYDYTRNGSPAAITMPDRVGTFELRYVIGSSNRTLASRTIELTQVSGTLEAPDSVAAGSEFEVNWTGPDNQNDYIAIVEVGADEGTYLDYARTRSGSTVKVTAPDAVGAYEIRYVINQSGRTLVAIPIELSAVSGTLAVDNLAVPGGKLSVSWTGPDNPNDFITIVEVGADEGAYSDYARTRNGSPAEIDVPRALGSFEVRYVVNASNRTLVSIPITLAPASATLSATPSVAAGGVVEAKWTGPGNRNDFIEIVPVGADAEARPITDARTSQGSPLSLFAPGSAGQYEVRYKMRDTGEVLASSELSVE